MSCPDEIEIQGFVEGSALARIFPVLSRVATPEAQGGDEGRALAEKATRALAAEGLVRPDRFAAMLAPGMPG